MDLDLKLIAQRLDQKPLTYRLRVLFLGLLALFLVWDFGIQGLIIRQKLAANDEIETLKKEIHNTQEQASKTAQEISQLSHPELMQQQENLQKQIKEVDVKIGHLLLSVSAKDRMLKAAVELLKETQNIVLLSVRSNTAEPVPTRHSVSRSTAEPIDKELVKNSFEIVFEADYFSTLAYIERLEKNERMFIWEKLHYTVNKYPKAQVSLDLGFLSEG